MAFGIKKAAGGFGQRIERKDSPVPKESVQSEPSPVAETEPSSAPAHLVEQASPRQIPMASGVKGRSRDEKFDETMLHLRSLCMENLDPEAITRISREQLLSEIKKLVSEKATQHRLQINGDEQVRLSEAIIFDMLGFGPLEPLLEDDAITEIMVISPTQTFIERRGKSSIADVKFRDKTHLMNVCQRIAMQVGRRVDESSPLCDCRLLDGSRVNIVFPPLALNGPYLTLRKHYSGKVDFEQLIKWGAMNEQVAKVLKLMGRARFNIVVSGGTGSGKTTMLKALASQIDPLERIITIEDVSELNLDQPHVVPMETRPANLEGMGEITQRDLMKNALRMRPDRIIPGECRGAETFDMLQAMNTGHDGSMTTVHANTSRDAITRIENMVQMGQMGLPILAVRGQIKSAIDIIVHVERQRDGGRRLTQITEICGMEGDTIILRDIFKFVVTGETADGKLIGNYEVSTLPLAERQ